MNDAPLVRRLQRLGDLLPDQQGFVKWDRSTRGPLGEILALDELHHEGLDAVAVFQSVDGRDVRMIQGGEDFGFALKPSEPIVVSSERGWQNLDRDLTLQLRVGRAIHLAHPAFADLRGDVVNADAGTWTEGQMWS